MRMQSSFLRGDYCWKWASVPGMPWSWKALKVCVCVCLGWAGDSAWRQSKVPGCGAPSPHSLCPSSLDPQPLFSYPPLLPGLCWQILVGVPVAFSPDTNPMPVDESVFQSFWTNYSSGCMCIYASQFSRVVQSMPLIWADLLCHMLVVPPWASWLTSLSFQILH